MSLFRNAAIEKSRNDAVISIATRQDPYSILFTVVIFAIFVVATIWFFSGSYSRSISVQGQVILDKGSSEIISPRQATIRTVSTAEGDEVKKGQILAVMVSDTANEKGVDRSKGEILNIQRQIAIDQSEIDAIGREGNTQSRATRLSLDLLATEKSAIQHQEIVQKQVVETLNSEMAALDNLDKKGFISKLDYHNREQQLANSEEDLAKIERDGIQNNQSAVSSQQSLSVSQADNMSRIASMQRDIIDLKEKEDDVSSSSSFTITSPYSGEIAEIRMHPGQTVKPTDTLAVITPKDYIPIAEIYLPTQAVAFVHAGQQISIMYDAFPYQTYGSFPGRVISVAKAAIPVSDVSQAAKSNDPIYVAKVALPDREVAINGSAHPLRSGMTLSATIPLNHETFFEWMTSSIIGVHQRSRFN